MQPDDSSASDARYDETISVFDQVLALCQSFASECETQRRPDLETYLDRIGEDSRDMLFRNLLEHEVTLRRQAGEEPTADEYHQRFPQFGDVIREAFFEATVTGAGQKTPTAETVSTMPAASRLGDYQLVRQIGRGGMGMVFEAEHVHRGNRVALKTLPTLDGPNLHNFKREFRSLADVHHPNLVGLHSLEADGNQWFFTMDLLQGVDFLEYVRPNGELDETRLRQALTQLVTGVRALHANHIVHRDLKPGNVMVSPDGHVALLDFGLVIELDSVSISQESISGTPAYMAPEQAAGQRVTEACDWYAVGVMLYEAVTGERPFSGAVLKILTDKQRLDPPTIVGREKVPDDLGSLAMRLLARDAADRPDDAQIAVAVSAEAAEAIPTLVSTTGDEQLIGREQQIASMQDAYKSFQQDRQTTTLFVSGRSGEGKTSLVEHFLAPLRGDSAVVVLSGRCYDRESVPFKALDSLIDALTTHLGRLGEKAALLIPNDIGLLVNLFPAMKRVEVINEAMSVQRPTQLDDQQVRQRAFAALRELLQRLGQSSLTILFADDLQWGDKDSAEALLEVLSPPDAPQILFLGSYRSDEADDSPFLQEWRREQDAAAAKIAQLDVTVGRLTVEQCRELIAAELSIEVDEAVIAELMEEAGGNPFLLTELLGFVDASTGQLERIPLSEVIARKLDRLPDDASALLDIICVSGQALAFHEASLAMQLDAQSVGTITHMRNERLLRLTGTDEAELQIDTYHDKIRETVLANLSADVRRDRHLSLAQVIESDEEPLSDDQLDAIRAGRLPDEAAARVFDLAYHFHEGGDLDRAFAYAMLAGRQARRQLALDSVVEQLDIARRSGRSLPSAGEFHIAIQRGEALMLLGRYDEAEPEFEIAASTADSDFDRARVEALQGELTFKEGLVDKSIETYESGLRRLGVWVPRTRFGLMYGIVRESLIQCRHSLLPMFRHKQTPDSRRIMAVRLFNRLTNPYVFCNTLKMIWCHLASVNRAERLPRSPQLTYSYAMHACMMAMLGWQARGSRFGERAMELAREYDDRFGVGQSCNYQGIGCYAAARYEEGLERLGEAIDAFDQTGDLYELHLARFHRGCCNFGLGNLSEAIREARETFASSDRLGDSRTLCSSYLWARATGGDIPFEQLKCCYPDRPDDVMSTVHGVMAEGHWHTFHGRTGQALSTFERAAEMVRKSLCVNSHTILALSNLASAARLHADTLKDTHSQQSAALLSRALRLGKWAVRMTRLFPAAYPISLRELSLIYQDKGKIKKALKLADRSCSVAERQQAKYEHAQSLLLRGRLAQQLGRPKAAEQIAEAQSALAEFSQSVQAAAS